jgi:hypothetical protein
MEQQRKEIDLEQVKSYMDDKYHLLYVDRNNNLNDRYEVFSKCLKDRKVDYLHDFFNDRYQDQEYNNASKAMEELKKRVVATGFKRWQAEKFFEENEDDVRDEIYSRGEYDDVEKLLRNTRDIPVRVEMLSNYDCINSHRLESQGGFSYGESYFGDMIDALWLNPKKVKRLLVSHGETVCGRFPNRAYRDGRELVSYKQFYEELINSSCGANLLTFTATINPMKLYESGFNLSTLTIPRGNRCGLFSSLWGGGSILEMVLERDVTVDLERTKYPQYRLEFETNGRDGDYSIRQVYGCDNSTYGKPARIEPLHADKRISA